MFPPDNFVYFVLLFGINVSLAVYLFFTYSRNNILLMNAIGFLLLAARSCTEYYLPQIEDFQIAYQITLIHSFFTTIASCILWISAWLYIRPFKNNSQEKLFNQIYIWILSLTHIPVVYFFTHRTIFKLHDTKLDGYWKFSTDYSNYSTYLFFFSMIFFSIVTVILFIMDYRRSKKNRIYKILLILIFIIFPMLIYYSIMNINPDVVTYSIPNTAIFYTINIMIANWFFNDYRLFSDTSGEIIGDTFNSISDAVIFTEPNLLIKQYNKVAEDIFLINEFEPNLVSLLTRESRMLADEVKDFVNVLLEHSNQDYELELIIENEKKLFLIKSANYIKGGKLFGYTFFIKDITDERIKEKLLEEQNQKLEELNQIKDQIFAIIGHDLRNPVLTFRGIAEKVNYLLKNEQYEVLDKLGNEIEKDAQALANLTDNLLNWALMQKNVMPYQPVLINLNELVEETISIFERRRIDKTIDLQININEQLKVFVDENSVRTIIRNIVDNAFKYSTNNSKIEITTFLGEEQIALQIKDNGTGMSAQQLEEIFLLKKDKSEKGTHGEKGTGLGMYLVNELVKMNQGKIRVGSIEGKGTTFTISLPAKVD